MKYFFLSLLLVTGIKCFAQLPDFTVEATSTAQTCLGNGSISFVVTGTNPSAIMAYQVFLLPDTTTPVATVTDETAANLVAGDYLIVAIQTLGNQSNSSTDTVTIANQVVPLVYTLTTIMPVCNTNGSVTVNVTSGTAVSYQIISGPVTTPQQTSGIFNNLPVGAYQVKVFDNCGDAIVVSVQLINESSNVNILLNEGVAVGLEDCVTMLVKNNYHLSLGQYLWPLTFQYTVYPPGGAPPVAVTSVVTSGNPINNQIITGIPYYPAAYHYDLVVTDACGNQFTENNNYVNGTPVVLIQDSFDPCNVKGFVVNPDDYVIFPYTVTFLSAPPGFNPYDYNASFPVFEEGPAVFEIPGTLIPLGGYSIKVTDACGKEIFKTYAAEPNDNGPSVSTTGTGCGLGRITVIHPKPVEILEIVAAPAGYPETLPQNVINFVGPPADYAIPDLPPGSYTIRVVDVCGFEYFRNANILAQQPATVSYLAGCEEGFGSVRIDMDEDPITSFIITGAPAAFTQPLPYDASENVAPNGLFYMNSLPGGNYSVMFTSEECTEPRSYGFIVIPYNIQLNEVDIIRNCNSFDIDLHHTSNTFGPSYFLQKYDAATASWVHPGTGVAYIEGTAATPLNSKPLTNNSLNLNQAYTGHFRIIKSFNTFGNGVIELTPCIDVLDEFDFEEGPQIINAYGFPCDDGLADVIIEATGLPPLTYNITTKNGDPFLINNGGQSLFEGLEPGVYNFEVTDVCGDIRNILYDINLLEGFEIQAGEFCEGQAGLLTLPSFPFLVYQWYKADDPATILSTTNALQINNFDPGDDIGIYKVHVVSNTPGSCIDLLLQYEVETAVPANAGEDMSAVICNSGSVINLNDFLGNPHDEGGIWSIFSGNAVINGNQLFTNGLAEGIYQFKYTVTKCNTSDEAIVTLTLFEAPELPVVTVPNTICEGNDIYFTVNDIPGAVYQWTGPNGFISNEQNPVITAADISASGVYSVTAANNNCLSPIAEVNITVTPVPDFTIDGNTSLCPGQTSVLSIIPHNFDLAASEYTWYYNGVLQAGLNTPTITIMQSGEFKVLANLNSCMAEQIINVMDNNDAFIVEVSHNCVNDEYVLSVKNAGQLAGYQINWEGPDNFNHSGAEAIITGLDTGNYTVRVINPDGCIVEKTLNVSNTLCEIPRGISPNNDGANDYFDLSNFKVEELKVFNRFGVEVYQQVNYVKEWDGQSGKGTLPAGTYYYAAKLSDGTTKTGWVYLQR